MGVPNVWMIDPQQRIARVCHGSYWTEVTRFTVEGGPIYVDVEALFARLDKYGQLPVSSSEYSWRHSS